MLLTKADYDEAEPLYRRALQINEDSYGKNHPNVAISLNNLAQLLQDTNRLSEVEPLIRRALQIDEAIYGQDHPRVAVHLNNLAELLKATNLLSEAEPQMRRGLQILIAVTQQGYQHPNLETGINNYIGCLQAQGRSEDAIQARIASLIPKD